MPEFDSSQLRLAPYFTNVTINIRPEMKKALRATAAIFQARLHDRSTPCSFATRHAWSLNLKGKR
jgi:hypothetical protein